MGKLSQCLNNKAASKCTKNEVVLIYYYFRLFIFIGLLLTERDDTLIKYDCLHDIHFFWNFYYFALFWCNKLIIWQFAELLLQLYLKSKTEKKNWWFLWVVIFICGLFIKISTIKTSIGFFGLEFLLLVFVLSSHPGKFLKFHSKSTRTCQCFFVFFPQRQVPFSCVIEGCVLGLPSPACAVISSTGRYWWRDKVSRHQPQKEDGNVWFKPRLSQESCRKQGIAVLCMLWGRFRLHSMICRYQL